MRTEIFSDYLAFTERAGGFLFAGDVPGAGGVALAAVAARDGSSAGAVAGFSWRGEVTRGRGHMSFAAHAVPEAEERENAQAAALGERLRWRAGRNADSYHEAPGKRVRTFEAKEFFAAMRAAANGLEGAE
jgi:hypothetical protein